MNENKCPHCQQLLDDFHKTVEGTAHCLRLRPILALERIAEIMNDTDDWRRGAIEERARVVDWLLQNGLSSIPTDGGEGIATRIRNGEHHPKLDKRKFEAAIAEAKGQPLVDAPGPLIGTILGGMLGNALASVGHEQALVKKGIDQERARIIAMLQKTVDADNHHKYQDPETRYAVALIEEIKKGVS